MTSDKLKKLEKELKLLQKNCKKACFALERMKSKYKKEKKKLKELHDAVKAAKKQQKTKCKAYKKAKKAFEKLENKTKVASPEKEEKKKKEKTSSKKKTTKKQGLLDKAVKAKLKTSPKKANTSTSTKPITKKVVKKVSSSKTPVIKKIVATKAAEIAKTPPKSVPKPAPKPISPKMIQKKPVLNTPTKPGTPPKAQVDNLKRIEGIGPKIEQLLKTAGITTFEKLSQSQPDTIREILLAAGSRYRMHNPDTWPEQAGMAAKGDFVELKKWQDELKGGRKV